MADLKCRTLVPCCVHPNWPWRGAMTDSLSDRLQLEARSAPELRANPPNRVQGLRAQSARGSDGRVQELYGQESSGDVDLRLWGKSRGLGDDERYPLVCHLLDAG